MTGDKLLAAIEKTQTAEISKNVHETGELINKEDGTANSIDAIENYFV